MGKLFVIGDIHGGYKALMQCLQRSKFDYEKDTLIQLGDITDGWSEVYACVNELLKIKNLIPIKGNHDSWFETWLRYGEHPCSWLQGGDGTLISYCRELSKEYVPRMGGYTTNLLSSDLPSSHYEFFTNKQIPYYVDSENRLYVHGGLNRHHPIDDILHNNEDVLMWDRDFFMAALSYGKIEPDDILKYPNRGKFKINGDFKEVFLGHTSTINWKTDQPINAANVWNLDTGGGYNGKLTIMDIDTKEYWQSDNLLELYINEKGRN